MLNLANLYALKGLIARGEAQYMLVSKKPDGVGIKAKEKLIALLAGRQSYDRAVFEYISMVEAMSWPEKGRQTGARDFLKVLKSDEAARE